jgi:hypothetical protein
MQKTVIQEQKFFEDPALDRAFGVVMALATEVYVLRDRQRATEMLLAKQGLINLESLNAEPTAEERLENKQDQQAFVNHLMEHISGKQTSKGLN